MEVFKVRIGDFLQIRRCNLGTEVGQIYYCEICGNKVRVLENGEGELVCCGEPMKLVES